MLDPAPVARYIASLVLSFQSLPESGFTIQCCCKQLFMKSCCNAGTLEQASQHDVLNRL